MPIMYNKEKSYFIRPPGGYVGKLLFHSIEIVERISEIALKHFATWNEIMEFNQFNTALTTPFS